MINVTFNSGEVDYTSLVVATASLITALVALLYSVRQFKISAEMNYATMTIDLVDKINSHSENIQRASDPFNETKFKFAIIDFVNTIDISCTFALSHKTSGRLSSYFIETLSEGVITLEKNSYWLEIMRSSINSKHEFTGLKEYAGAMGTCENLCSILAGQRRQIGDPSPWTRKS